MIKAIIFDVFGVIYLGPVINEELMDYIPKLAQNFSLAILSNIAAGKLDYYIAEEDRQYFDVILGSGDIGVWKPHEAAYQVALNRLQVAAEEAVMIDDSIDNIEAAKHLGMQTVHYRSLPQLKAELHKLFESV